MEKDCNSDSLKSGGFECKGQILKGSTVHSLLPLITSTAHKGGISRLPSRLAFNFSGLIFPFEMLLLLGKIVIYFSQMQQQSGGIAWHALIIHQKKLEKLG